MIMNIITICFFSLSVCISSVLLRSVSSPYAAFVSLGGCVLILLSFLGGLSGIFSDLNRMSSLFGVASDYLSCLIKCLGICFVTSLAADVCHDCGESALSSQTVIAGKISLILTALPLINDILKSVMALIE